MGLFKKDKKTKAENINETINISDIGEDSSAVENLEQDSLSDQSTISDTNDLHPQDEASINSESDTIQSESEPTTLNDSNDESIDAEPSTEDAKSNSESSQKDGKTEKKEHKKLSKKKKRIILIATTVAIVLLTIILVSVLVPLAQKRGKLFVSKPEDFNNPKNKTFDTFVLEKDIELQSVSEILAKYLLEAKGIDFNGHSLTVNSGDFVYGNESLENVVLGKKNSKAGKLLINNGSVVILGKHIDIYSSITNNTEKTAEPTSNIKIEGSRINVFASINSAKNQIAFSSKSTLENSDSLIADKISASEGIVINSGKFNATNSFGDKQKVILETLNPEFPAILEKLGDTSTSTSKVILKNGALLILNGKDHKIDTVEGFGTNNIIDGKKGSIDIVLNVSKVIIHNESFSVSQLHNSQFIRVSKIKAPINIEHYISFDEDNKIYLTLSPEQNIASIQIVNIDDENKKLTHYVHSYNDLNKIDVTSIITSPAKISLKMVFFPEEELIYKNYDSLVASKTYFEESSPIFYTFSPKIVLHAPYSDFTGVKEVDSLEGLLMTIHKVAFAEEYELYINSQKVDSFKGDSFEGSIKKISIITYKDIIKTAGKYSIYWKTKNSSPNVETSQRGAFATIILKGRHDLTAWETETPNYIEVPPSSQEGADPENYLYKISFKEIKDASLYKITYKVAGADKECIISQSSQLLQDGVFRITLKEASQATNFQIKIIGNDTYFNSDNINLVVG